MHIGLVGLGKMGGNMRARMRKAGLTVVGFDRNPDVSDVENLEALADQLPSPKVVWVMVPAGEPTRETVLRLADLLGDGDLVVDGGNSKWTDDQVHACSPRRGSGSSTAVSPVASGAWRTATP
jgi:6-phosphogluconate dehydrogenase